MHPPQTEPRDRNALLSGFIDLMAGSLGGCANVLVGQPLDTVKVSKMAIESNLLAKKGMRVDLS